MRYLIGGLALATAALAVAIWLLPQMVDEREIELQLARLLENSTGQVFEIEGGLDLAVVPRPILTINQIAIGDEAAPVRVNADRMDLVVGFGSILSGQLEVREAKLVRPEFVVSGSRSGLAAGLLRNFATGAFSHHVEQLSIVDGTIAVGAVSALLFDDVIAEWQHDRETAESRLEIRASGIAGATEESLSVTIETGAHRPDRPIQFGLDATLSRSDDFDQFTFSGLLDSAGTELAGHLSAELSRLGRWIFEPTRNEGWPSELLLEQWAPVNFDSQVSLRFGPEDDATSGQLFQLLLADSKVNVAGQALTGSLQIAAGAWPEVDLEISADRFVFPDGTIFDLEQLGLFVDWLPRAVEGHAVVEIGEAEWRGQTLHRSVLELSFDGTGDVVIDRAAAKLPGPGDLEFAGRLQTAGLADPILSGELDLSLQAPAEFASALFETPPALNSVSTMAIATDLEWRSDALTLQSTSFSLDSLNAEGALAWRSGGPRQTDRPERPRLALLAVMDRLDIDDFVDTQAPQAAIDELGRLASATDLAIDLRAERTRLGGSRLGGLVLQFDSEDGTIDLQRLSLADAVGTSLTLAGTLEPSDREFNLDVALDIASLPRLARLVDQSVPLELALLGPLNVRATASGNAAQVQLNYDIEADQFDAAGRATVLDWVMPPSGDVSLKVQVGEAIPILRQLSHASVSDRLLDGALEAEIDVSINGGTPTHGEVNLTVGDLIAELRFGSPMSEPATVSTRPRITASIGPVTASAANDLYELLTMPLGLVPGPIETWPGYWPAQQLDWQWLETGETDLALTIELEDPRFSPIELVGSVAGGRVTIPTLDWQSEAGRVSGALAMVRREGAGVDLAVDFALETFDSAMISRALGIGVGAEDVHQSWLGTVDLNGRVATTGQSFREWVANIDGSFDLVAYEAQIDLVGDGETVSFDQLSGPFAIKRGVVMPGDRPTTVTSSSRSGVIDGSVDLLAWMVDLGITIDDDLSAGGEWRLFGPLADPDLFPKRTAKVSPTSGVSKPE